MEEEHPEVQKYLERKKAAFLAAEEKALDEAKKQEKAELERKEEAAKWKHLSRYSGYMDDTNGDILDLYTQAEKVRKARTYKGPVEEADAIFTIEDRLLDVARNALNAEVDRLVGQGGIDDKMLAMGHVKRLRAFGPCNEDPGFEGMTYEEIRKANLARYMECKATSMEEMYPDPKD